jgi:hypothetical protein
MIKGAFTSTDADWSQNLILDCPNRLGLFAVSVLVCRSCAQTGSRKSLLDFDISVLFGFNNPRQSRWRIDAAFPEPSFPLLNI